MHLSPVSPLACAIGAATSIFIALHAQAAEWQNIPVTQSNILVSSSSLDMERKTDRMWQSDSFSSFRNFTELQRELVLENRTGC